MQVFLHSPIASPIAFPSKKKKNQFYSLIIWLIIVALRVP